MLNDNLNDDDKLTSADKKKFLRVYFLLALLWEYLSFFMDNLLTLMAKTQ